MREIFLPPGVQMRFANRGESCPREVEDAIAERIEALWRRRNHVMERDVAPIDDSMEALARDGRVDYSLLPIDCGFDPRAHDDMSIELTPAYTHVRYELDGDERVATGSYDHILRELQAAGFDYIVCDVTPNGRNVYFAEGKYTVQPHNDNYLIRVDTLDKAHAAYHDPHDWR